MKNTCTCLSLIIILALASISFTHKKLGGIIGKVNPLATAASADLINGRDTLKAGFSGGAFSFSNLKEGVYTLKIKANIPYRDTIIKNIAVKDSSITDIGLIRLMP